MFLKRLYVYSSFFFALNKQCRLKIQENFCHLYNQVPTPKAVTSILKLICRTTNKLYRKIVTTRKYLRYENLHKVSPIKFYHYIRQLLFLCINTFSKTKLFADGNEWRCFVIFPKWSQKTFLFLDESDNHLISLSTINTKLLVKFYVESNTESGLFCFRSHQFHMLTEKTL